MGMLIGYEFEDYGNAPEVLIESKAIPAWEILKCGMVRLFVCREVQNKLVLDHTDLITPDDMETIGKRFLEIAREVKAPKPNVCSDGAKVH